MDKLMKFIVKSDYVFSGYTNSSGMELFSAIVLGIETKTSHAEKQT